MPLPSLRHASVALTGLVLLAGCSNEGSDPTSTVGTGTVVVSVTTTGEQPDADGYSVALGSRTATVEPSGTVTFEDVAPGSYEVTLSDVAPNCTVDGEASRMVTLDGPSGAEVAFTLACVATGPAGSTVVPCPDVALASGSGAPLDEIDLGMLPASFEAPVAGAVFLGSVGTSEGSDPVGLAFVRTDASGDASAAGPRLIVPLHPSEALAGGAVSVVLTDGSLACAPMDLTIEPLPAADGELAAVVDLLQNVLAEQAELFDTTVEFLRSSDADDLPPALWPLAMAQTVLDDPSNPQSLRAVAEGAVDEEALDWVDRLLARTALSASLTAAPDAAPFAVSRTSRPARVPAIACVPEAVGQASRLDECMAAAAEARDAASSLSQKVVDDLVAALGEAAKHNLPGAGAVQSVLSSVSWLVTTERAKTAALYPSGFTDMTVEIDRDRFIEDEEATGHVTRAEVYATNEGYDLLKEIIDGVKQAMSLAQTTADFDFSTGTDADKVLPRLQKELRGALENKARDMALEDFNIEPEMFGPVDVNDPEWIQLDVHGEQAIAVPTGTTTYVPNLEGQSILSVRTRDGSFGGAQISDQLDVVVPPIAVSFSPDDLIVEPGDPDNLVVLDLELKVEEAMFPDRVELDQSDHPRQGEAFFTPTPDSDTHVVEYVAPIDPDFDEPDLVIVKYTGTTGARENAVEERIGMVTIRFGEIQITPRTACLTPGEPLQMEANVQGPDDRPVVWEADVGEIDASGSYTAPSELPPDGIATIRAHVQGLPTLDDEVTLSIGGCTCGWSMTLDGVTVEGQPGDSITFQENVPGGEFEMLLGIRLNTADGKVVHISAEEGGTEPVGGAVSYDAKISGNVGTAVTPPYMGYGTRYPGPYTGDEPEWAEARATLFEYEVATALRGAVLGRVALHENEVDIDDAPRVDFEATFHVTIPADYSSRLRFYRTFTCEIPEGG